MLLESLLLLPGSMWWIAPVSRHQPLVDVVVLCHSLHSYRTANRDTAEGTAFSLQADTTLCVKDKWCSGLDRSQGVHTVLTDIVG